MSLVHGSSFSLRAGRVARPAAIARTHLAVVVICLVASVAAEASSVLLFDNGPVIGDTGRCDQGPTGCAGSGTWTYYDNFSVAGPSIITDFDYTDHFFTDGSGPANYVTTNWSLWDSDPFTAAAPVVSGSTVATIVPAGPYHQFSIGGLNQVLPAGVYWLGINNTVTNGIEMTAAHAVGVLPGAKQSDGVTHFFENQPERAFRIYGRAVPEPAGIILVVFGLAAGSRFRAARVRAAQI
jgi:hypothetical protein